MLIDDTLEAEHPVETLERVKATVAAYLKRREEV